MKKHIVLVKARNIEKFNYVKFGNYKDGKGKNRILIDPNGEKLQGYEMFNAVKSLEKIINIFYTININKIIKINWHLMNIK